ncbi:MAG: lysostaphin resistance A-like protein [Pseudomonadota bacterium]
MVLYESVILVLTFLFLNLPVFYSLYIHIFWRYNIFARLSIFIAYWTAAFYTYEFIPFIGVLALLLVVHCREEKQVMIRDINIWHFSFRDFFLTVIGAVVFKALINQLNILYVNIISAYSELQLEPQEIVQEFATDDFFYKLMLFLMVVIMAPFVEEYVFRYFLYDRLLLPRMPVFAAAVISSAFFTLLHFNMSGVPTFFGLGLFCTYMYERKGYYGAVVAHIVSNLATAVLLM